MLRIKRYDWQHFDNYVKTMDEVMLSQMIGILADAQDRYAEAGLLMDVIRTSLLLNIVLRYWREYNE